jgi:hypothetical protein
MTLDEVIADLSARIRDGSPAAVVRVIRRSAEEASIRAYAPVEDETAIKEATQEITLSLLTNDGWTCRCWSTTSRRRFRRRRSSAERGRPSRTSSAARSRTSTCRQIWRTPAAGTVIDS